MQAKLHWAERFMNWFPAHTQLYIRGERGKSRREVQALRKELFDKLAPFLDRCRAEAKAEEREECAKACEQVSHAAGATWRMHSSAHTGVWACVDAIRERGKA